MIAFHFETDIELNEQAKYTDWINRSAAVLKVQVGSLQYIFCSDEELRRINQKYLSHDYYTDIITFPYEEGTTISGDIYISVDRVRENAVSFQQGFEEELRRVMIHGVLHLAGYTDKTEPEKETMRKKESELMEMFHVKH